MTDRIELRGMRFEGRHGVLPEEATAAQPFEVDVVLELDLAAAGASDDLGGTVDYGDVFRRAGRSSRTDRTSRSSRRSPSGSRPTCWRPIRRPWQSRCGSAKPRAPLPGDFAWAGVEIRRAGSRAALLSRSVALRGWRGGSRA